MSTHAATNDARVEDKDKDALARVLHGLSRDYDEVDPVPKAFEMLCRFVDLDTKLEAAAKKKDEAGLQVALAEAKSFDKKCVASLLCTCTQGLACKWVLAFHTPTRRRRANVLERCVFLVGDNKGTIPTRPRVLSSQRA